MFGVSAETACAYCHLPIPRLAVLRAGRADEPVYCCYGCRLAAQITTAQHEQGGATWMLTRLGTAVALSMVVMVFSLPMYGQEVYGVDLTEGSPLVVQLTGLFRYASLVLSAPVFILLGLPILSNAMDQIRRGIVSTDALVVLGVAATFVYSYVSTVTDSGRTYYETACMVLVLITLGRYLEATGKLKASSAVAAMESLMPDEVRVTRGGDELILKATEVRVGDTVHIAAGERIAVDGSIESGEAHVDERIVTGEAEPVVKKAGDAVPAGAINLDGTLAIRASAVGAESTLGRLTALLEEAKRSKGRFERLADRVSTVFVPCIVILAVVSAALGWRRAGGEEAIMSGLAVLLISCPCALGIATPMAIWVAFGRAASHGVLFRNGSAVEALSKVRAVAFDKTGTLTTGVPTVSSFIGADQDAASQMETIGAAAALGATSRHLLSLSVVAYAQEKGVALGGACNARTVAGRGVVGEVGGATVRLGNVAMMRDERVEFDEAIGKAMRDVVDGGQAIACVGVDRRVAGLFSFSETLRTESRAAIEEISRGLGCAVRVLTGDHGARGRAIAEELGVETLAELSPADKMDRLADLRREVGPVAMIGDGLNDAPALAFADLGMAMGCGADVSREAADVCLLGDDLTAVPWSMRLARQTVKTVKLNLFWAFSYNVIGIPLAMTGRLSPMFAALAMVISSLIVVTNSLRLREANLGAAP